MLVASIILLDLQGDIIFLSDKDISILIKNISVINFPPLVKGGEGIGVKLRIYDYHQPLVRINSALSPAGGG